MPPALTLRAASLVPVNQDSPEMDSHAQVNRKIFERYGKVQRSPVYSRRFSNEQNDCRSTDIKYDLIAIKHD